MVQLSEMRNSSAILISCCRKMNSWAICYREDTALTANNTNKTVESSSRILKEKIFARSKSFNSMQLIDFFRHSPRLYYDRRLVNIANNRLDCNSHITFHQTTQLHCAVSGYRLLTLCLFPAPQQQMCPTLLTRQSGFVHVLSMFEGHHASISGQLLQNTILLALTFCQSHLQLRENCSSIWLLADPFPSKLSLPTEEIWTPIWFLVVPTRVQKPKGISIGSAAFAGLTTVTDQPTGRPHFSICNNRPPLRSTVTQPNNNTQSERLFLTCKVTSLS